jgi:hypothetical protein
MRTVKYGCLLSSLGCIVGAILLAIECLRLGHATEQSTPYPDTWLIVILFFAGIIYAVMFSGIHRRTPLSWKLGFVMLVWIALNSLAQIYWPVIHPRAHQMAVSPWFVGALALSTMGVMVFAGVWWTRQRSYFVN